MVDRLAVLLVLSYASSVAIGQAPEEVFTETFDDITSLGRWEVWREGPTPGAVEWVPLLGEPDPGSVRLHVPPPLNSAVRLMTPCYPLIPGSDWEIRTNILYEESTTICDIGFFAYRTSDCSDEPGFFHQNPGPFPPDVWRERVFRRPTGFDVPLQLLAIRAYVSQETFGQADGGCSFDTVSVRGILPSQVPSPGHNGAVILAIVLGLSGLWLLRLR